MPEPDTLASVVLRLRAAGCVFAEDEAAILIEAATATKATTGVEATTSTEAALTVRSVTGTEFLDTLVARRVSGEPLEQVVGWADFCGVRVRLRPGVFVPRVRSELLVRLAAAEIGPRAVVVDLCCGSGALGLALRSRRPDIRLHAADLDPVAVTCAAENLGVAPNPGTARNAGAAGSPGTAQNPGAAQNPGTAGNPNTAQNPGAAQNPGTAGNPSTAQNLGTVGNPDTTQDLGTTGNPSTPGKPGAPEDHDEQPPPEAWDESGVQQRPDPWAEAGGQDRPRVHQGDLFHALPPRLRGRIDLLLANVPYVATRHIPFLPAEARDHEPHTALDGGDDGLAIFRRVVAGAADWLSPTGLLISEITEAQTRAAIEVVERHGLTATVLTDDDLDARAILARRR
ncbi:methyltransferase [Actinoplanes sp. G11-F43]|uniref:methyltransferase n=1 Tax=Actinoplanes sp. G11-F43 TaxID=3424130 RepID=UPI003D3444E7